MALPSIYWTPSPKYNTPAQTKPNYGVPRTVEYIVIHHWDDPAKNPTFDGTVNFLLKPYNASDKATLKSVHYIVEAGRILQMVGEENTAWHAGAVANPRSIGMECNPRYSAEDQQTVAELIVHLWRKYGVIPVYPHKKFASTACPGRYDTVKLEEMARTILNPPAPAPTPAPEIPKPPELTPIPPEKPQEGPVSRPTVPNPEIAKIEDGKAVMRMFKWTPEMYETLKRALIRGIRAALATLISLVAADLANDPVWLGLAPILLFLDKFIRGLLDAKKA